MRNIAFLRFLWFLLVRAFARGLHRVARFPRRMLNNPPPPTAVGWVLLLAAAMHGILRLAGW